MRGHPIRGAIFGLLFGLFLGVELMMFKAVTLGRFSTVVLPLLFLAIGIALGFWAPLARKKAAPAAAAATPPEAPGADEPPD